MIEEIGHDKPKGNWWLHHGDKTGVSRRPPKIEGGHFWALSEERVNYEAAITVDSP